MSLFRRKPPRDEAPEPAPEEASATPASQPVEAEETATPPHGDQLQEAVDVHPAAEEPAPSPSDGSDEWTARAEAVLERPSDSPPPLSRRERRRLEREERQRRREAERARREEERAAAKRRRKEARQKGDAPGPTEPEGGAEASEASASAVPADEERALREAAERAALARLGQAERPPESELIPEPPEDAELPPAVEPELDSLEEDERARQQQEERVRAEAERRIREVEAMQREGEGRSAPVAGREGEEPGVPEGSLGHELIETEQRLAESRQRTAEALDRAAQRLEQVESRAAEAERRAVRAEELAALKAEEIERAERLREMLDRIAKAEQRASEAERRARAAVERVSDPVPEVDPDAIFDRDATGESEESSEPELPATPPEVVPAPEEAPSPEEAPPPARALETPDESRSEAAVDINQATYEQLRGLGLSVTQTGRLLAHRERVGGFSSEQELDGIPGFPQGFLEELKGRIRI